ncbi:hypothetical protein FKM82_013127 [Ascaphus truei]
MHEPSETETDFIYNHLLSLKVHLAYPYAGLVLIGKACTVFLVVPDMRHINSFQDLCTTSPNQANHPELSPSRNLT